MTTTDLLAQYEQKIREEALHLGRREGREEGREKGREEGREEGREKGREEGRAEGLEGLRVATISVFEARFGAMPAELRARVARCADVSSLVRVTTASATERREVVEGLIRAWGD